MKKSQSKGILPAHSNLLKGVICLHDFLAHCEVVLTFRLTVRCWKKCVKMKYDWILSFLK